MHSLDGCQRYGFAISKLLRPDLACLGCTLVAVLFVKLDASLGVAADFLTVVGIGFKSLAVVFSP